MENLKNYGESIEDAYIEQYGESIVDGVNIKPQETVMWNKPVVESSSFLSLISSKVVTQIRGRILSYSLTGGAGYRSADNCEVRFASPFTDPSSREYNLREARYNYSLRYDDIDNLAGSGLDIVKEYNKSIVQLMGGDRLFIGFKGLSEADTTISDKNDPLFMTDLHKGWLQKIRDYAPAQYLADEVKIGVGGDAGDLTVAVNLALQTIADSKRANLAVILGQNIFASERTRSLASTVGSPSDREKLQKNTNTVCGMPIITSPLFPVDSMLITNPKNLVHYIQKGSVRRTIRKNSTCQQLENLYSLNESFEIADLEAVSLTEKISFVEESS